MKGGFGQSPLRLNEGLAELNTWDENAIRYRADRLAREAVKVWKGPSLGSDVLRPYLHNAGEPTKTYTIEDHSNLAEGSSARILFDDFRHEVLSLDPCVSEGFLKHYVAYNAETNFVDVVPQASRLSLILNMRYHELHDPKGIARDVTNIGRLGNGDVEVKLSSRDELPYVMGLVRQAFEIQMSDGGAEE